MRHFKSINKTEMAIANEKIDAGEPKKPLYKFANVEPSKPSKWN